jgi:hypothetical protein
VVTMQVRIDDGVELPYVEHIGHQI